MGTTRGRRPTRIGDILRERIDALGWGGRLREEQVIAGWEAVVGAQIAAHARASHINERRLTVITESPVWTQQLSLLKREVLRRITATFGPGVVADLYFVTGTVETTPAACTGALARRSAPAPPPAELERELGCITDPDLRDAIRRFMRAAADAGGAERPDTDPP